MSLTILFFNDQYAKVYHQKDMLEDVRRMRAYYGAIIGNRQCFKDKVVLKIVKYVYNLLTR